MTAPEPADKPERPVWRRSLPFKPGSLAWLVMHNRRLQFRALQRPGQKMWVTWVFLGLLFALMAASSGTGIFFFLSRAEGGFEELYLPVGVMVGAIVISGLSVNVMAAFAVLTDRDDLDLLMSAPILPQRLAAARLLSGALRSMSLYALFALAFLGVSMVMVSPLLTSVFAVVIALALVETCFGFAVARSLMLRFGARRGRMVAQMFGLGGLLAGVLGYQLSTQMRRVGEEMDGEALAEAAVNPEALFQAGYGALSWLTPLGRAILGDWLIALAMLAVALAVFAATLFWAGARYAHDVARLQAEANVTPTRQRRGQRVRLAGGTLVTGLRKEWRSMLRDPQILSQIAIPMVALVPAGFAMVRTLDGAEALVLGTLAGLGVMVSSQIVASLAWVCVSVEEAPDLVRAAPVHPRTHLTVKLAAVAGPGMLIVLTYAGAIGFVSVAAGLWTVAAGLLTAGAVTAIEFWRPRPARRARMTERQDRSVVSVLLGMLLGFCGGAIAALGAGGLGIWALIPLALGGCVVWIAWMTAPAERIKAGTGPLPPATGPWAKVSSSS